MTKIQEADCTSGLLLIRLIPNWPASICAGYDEDGASERYVAISWGTENSAPMYGGIAAYSDEDYVGRWYCTGTDIGRGGSSGYADAAQNKLVGRLFIDPSQTNDATYMEAYAEAHGMKYNQETDNDLKITCNYSAQQLYVAAMSGKNVSLLWDNAVARYDHSDHTWVDLDGSSSEVNYARFQLGDEEYIDVLEDKTAVFMKKPDVVSTAEQWLEEEAKAQARENIGAASKAELEAISASAGAGYTKEETLTS